MSRRQSGFTLPEVLIALLIFALIASACVYALRLGVDSRDQLTLADNNLKRVQIARILMKEDLAQVVLRPVRDEFGEALPGSFSGGQVTFGSDIDDDEKLLMRFVRAGWINPNAQSPRSALQHVEYIFKGGALIRRAHIYLDETENAEVVERVLFDNLEVAEAEFLTGFAGRDLEWANGWPVSTEEIGPPRAVAVILQEEGGEPLRQLFWIGEIRAVQS